MTAPEPTDRRVAEIDDDYSEVDPDEATEDAIDYFDGKPSTEAEQDRDEASERGTR